LTFRFKVGDPRREDRGGPSALVAEVLGDVYLDRVEQLASRYLEACADCCDGLRSCLLRSVHAPNASDANRDAAPITATRML